MRRASSVSLLVLASSLACSAEVTTPASSLSLVALDEPAGPTQQVGTSLPRPLRVRVEQDGIPQAGVTIHWGTSSGIMNPSTSVTDAQGITASQWVLGERAGEHRALSWILGGTRPVYFPVEATPGPAAELAKEEGDGQFLNVILWLSFRPLQVRVTDRYGNPVPLAEVTWTVLDGPVVLFGQPQSLGGGRHRQLVDKTGTVGEAKVRAEVMGTPIATVFDLTVGTGPLVVALSNLGTYHQVGFLSMQNRSSPAVDTLRAGGSVEFRHEDYWDVLADNSIIAVGLPAIPPCPHLIEYYSICEITLSIPGTYRYALASRPTIQGTLVVQ